MDGLISLLIVFGISALLSSRKRKKAQEKQAQKMRAFQEAAQSLEEGRNKTDRDVLVNLLKEQLEQHTPEGKAAVQRPTPKMKAAAPSVKPAASIVKPTASAAAPAAPTAKSAAPIVKPAAKAAAPVKRAAAPLLFLENDEPEGSVSTQGESPAEHAKHRQRVFAEEERLRLEHEAMQEVRHMNLKKLRTAVVMSEILDKPVSLRPRRFQ